MSFTPIAATRRKTTRCAWAAAAIFLLVAVSCAKNPGNPLRPAIRSTDDVTAVWSFFEAELTARHFVVNSASTVDSSLHLRDKLLSGEAHIGIASLDTLVVHLRLDSDNNRAAHLEQLNTLDQEKGVRWLTTLPFSSEINFFVSPHTRDALVGGVAAATGNDASDRSVDAPGHAGIAGLASFENRVLYRGPAILLIGEEYLPRIDAIYGLDIPRSSLVAATPAGGVFGAGAAAGGSGDHGPAAAQSHNQIIVDVLPAAANRPGTVQLRDERGAIVRGVPVVGVEVALLSEYPELEMLLTELADKIDAVAVAEARRAD